MKKIAIVILASLLATGALAAQSAKPGPGPGFDRHQAAQLASVEGKLTFLNGYICVVTPAKTWVVHIPAYLYGFIDGLKEGAQVKLEGRERPLPGPQTTSVLLVTKLTFAGKDYDLSRAQPGFGRFECEGERFGEWRGPGRRMMRDGANDRPESPAGQE